MQKFVRYLITSLVLIIALGSYAIYGMYHGKMYMNRIISMSQNGDYLFIGDFSRTQLFSYLYLNHYVFNSSVLGKTSHEEYTFFSFSENVSAYKYLSSYSEIQNFEIAKSNIELIYTTARSNNIKISTGDLNSYFVTKTDPEYFRFMSSGLGNMEVNGKQEPAYMLVDTIISHDTSHSRLMPGTKIDGFMGGFWDTKGNTYYFDKTEIIKKNPRETYTPHDYLLTLSKNQEAKKDSGIERIETSDTISVQSKDVLLFSAKKNNIIRIGNQILDDTYYLFTGVDRNNLPVYGFLNFVK